MNDAKYMGSMCTKRQFWSYIGLALKTYTSG